MWQLSRVGLFCGQLSRVGLVCVCQNSKDFGVSAVQASKLFLFVWLVGFISPRRIDNTVITSLSYFVRSFIIISIKLVLHLLN